MSPVQWYLSSQFVPTSQPRFCFHKHLDFSCSHPCSHILVCQALSLLVMLVGVGLATVSDVGLNIVGTIYALTAILATVIAQIAVKNAQQSLKLDHMQLLLHVSPIISCAMFASSPIFDCVFFDQGKQISLIHYIERGHLTLKVASWILLTCICAFSVNITNYLVIGKTSPVTYQVIGHFKTVLILLSGWLFTDQRTSYIGVMGTVVAVIGMMLYSYSKQIENNSAARLADKTQVAVEMGKTEKT